MAVDNDPKALLEKIAALENEAAVRKETEAKLKKQSDFLNSVLESLDHPFYVVDADNYSIKLANSAALKSGASGTSTCHALIHNKEMPCEPSEHPCPLEIIKKTKQPVQVEHVHYDSDGNPRYVEVHAHPILDEKGDVTQMIENIFDISERKQHEKELNQLIRSLEESLAQVRQLSGMLPICASCKKIRDDKGYWNQIEEYIRHHSEAEFSHGICPECSQKLYPEYHRQKQSNKDR